MKTDNELIEDFYVKHGGKPNLSADISFYESSWDMLMPVVEKIESTRVETQPHKLAFEFHCDITALHVVIDSIVRPSGQKRVRFVKIGDTKIEATYKAVVEFIKWYNQQTP